MQRQQQEVQSEKAEAEAGAEGSVCVPTWTTITGETDGCESLCEIIGDSYCL